MATHIETAGRLDDDTVETLFDRFHWLYAFCREHLSRDDTERIAITVAGTMLSPPPKEKGACPWPTKTCGRP